MTDFQTAHLKINFISQSNVILGFIECINHSTLASIHWNIKFLKKFSRFFSRTFKIFPRKGRVGKEIVQVRLHVNIAIFPRCHIFLLLSQYVSL